MTINNDVLRYALSNKHNQDIINVSYSVSSLQGGTLAKVSLVVGNAELRDGSKQPFQLVLKVQTKWERYADPTSWRREYDLYASGLEVQFTNQFRWPRCFYATMNEAEDEFQLWLEYCEGVSGLQLTGEQYELAAKELGCFQGRVYAEQGKTLERASNIGPKHFPKHTYEHYRSWPLVYNYIRSDECKIPTHLSQMLIALDGQAEELFEKLEQLPTVFCHRDFWVNNIIYKDGRVLAIDWDTAGWGYLGEDIASLIVDEANTEQIPQYYERCIAEYYKGFMAYSGVTESTDFNLKALSRYGYKLMLIMFGYRLVETFVMSEEPAEQQEALAIMQGIYEIQLMHNE